MAPGTPNAWAVELHTKCSGKPLWWTAHKLGKESMCSSPYPEYLHLWDRGGQGKAVCLHGNRDQRIPIAVTHTSSSLWCRFQPFSLAPVAVEILGFLLVCPLSQMLRWYHNPEGVVESRRWKRHACLLFPIFDPSSLLTSKPWTWFEPAHSSRKSIWFPSRTSGAPSQYPIQQKKPS